jgi:PDZ domain-containing protein
MRRRTWAGVLAAVLVMGLAVVALSKPVPYVTFKPGPTVNVLGSSGKKEIIEISGHKTYDDDGALRLVTVIPSGPQDKVSIGGLVAGWISPDVAVYPYRAIYQATDTRQSVRQQSSIEMVSSQDSAVAAALGALDIPYKSGVKIASVQKGGPADGKLKVGDFVVSVDGKRVADVDQLTKAIRPLPIGSDVAVKVRRNQAERELTMTTASSPQDKKNSAVLVSIAPGYEFPFDVDLNLAQNIGGPSAGMMFALGIYDALTPGSLTRGKAIAGTGEIDAQGKVGEIGGIQQKLVGAQDDGARLFLVPAANCAEAVKGHYDPEKMRLVKVDNLKDAIADVKAWAEDPDADLPKCAA